MIWNPGGPTDEEHRTGAWRKAIQLALSAPGDSTRHLRHADLPREIVCGPFEPERDAVPDRQVHGCEEADQEREIDDRRPHLERVARPAVAQRGYNRDSVDGCRIRVDLRDGIPVFRISWGDAIPQEQTRRGLTSRGS